MWSIEVNLTIFSLLSILVLIVVYYFLITEKVNKAIVAMLGAAILIISQVFRVEGHTSQDIALEFISSNLDVLGFVIGMMILVGITKSSGFFEMISIWLVKKVKGQPTVLIWVIGLLAMAMTATFSNIPTVLILTPIIFVLVNELDLPYFPYIFTLISVANLSGAMTPISDPTTYYQAKTVGLGFMEVLGNSGVIVVLLVVVSLAYISFIFRKDLAAVKVDEDAVKLYDPREALGDRHVLKIGIPILFATISLLIAKNQIFEWTGITLDNATLTFAGAFLIMLLFHKEPKKIFANLIDWEIIFFFMGLFIIVGALEKTLVIEALAEEMVHITKGNITALLYMMSTGSALLSTFIDNVPYNITMVGAIQEMAKQGLYVYPLWWGLNLGTSIGGMGSPIAAASNVIVLGMVEKEKLHLNFAKYVKYALPLVIVNSLIAATIIWLRYL